MNPEGVLSLVETGLGTAAVEYLPGQLLWNSHLTSCCGIATWPAAVESTWPAAVEYLPGHLL